MTSKNVKNEQWYIKTLTSKIDSGEIMKPKFQRKRKWDTQPKKENNPNEKCYILFLFDVKNSVHAITFGQNMNSEKITYTNIDGNNRLNAIKHFIEKPFDIFPEYLKELFTYIDTLVSLEDEDKTRLKEIFKNISYNDIVEMKFHKYFSIINMPDFYSNKLKSYRDEFDNHIDSIQIKLRINGTDRFDNNVSVNVNLFEGYTTDELCKTFEDINKYNSKLTEIELLACSLYNNSDFKIKDNVIERSIINKVIEHYEEKCCDEVLKCYNYDINDTMNAFDFIVGLQNYCNETFNIIEKSDNDGLSLFFKIYKNLYTLIFNTENVNEFIGYMLSSCNILKKIYNNIFTEQINNKLFNKACENKFNSLKKNNLYLVITSIIGYLKKSTNEQTIINSIEKAILFHFFVNDVKDINKRELHKIKDSIQYEAGGSFIDAKAKKLLSEPNIISVDITKIKFKEIIDDLFLEGNAPHVRLLENGNKKNDKRRPRKFFEKCLLFYYYKSKVPTNLLNNTFSLEHIFPFSSMWDEELDIDRFGNTIPIIDEINNKRSNYHISKYNDLDSSHNFIKFINVIPEKNVYDLVISHTDRTPKITNNSGYNEVCSINEEIYSDVFLKSLYL